MSTENTASEKPRKDRKRYGKTFRIFLGSVFVVLGIIGSFLPVLQGWLFFLIAFVLLFPQHPKVIAVVEKLEKKHPKWARWLHMFGVADDQEHEEECKVSEQ